MSVQLLANCCNRRHCSGHNVSTTCFDVQHGSYCSFNSANWDSKSDIVSVQSVRLRSLSTSSSSENTNTYKNNCILSHQLQSASAKILEAQNWLPRSGKHKMHLEVNIDKYAMNFNCQTFSLMNTIKIHQLILHVNEYHFQASHSKKKTF